jgi:1-acyl-sn-glycerol-3-phosphate acyltransferase
VFYEVMKFLARPLCYLLFWPIVKGRHNIPATGPAIFASNHIGVGETFLLPVVVKPQVTFPAKKELFRTDTLLHRAATWFLTMIHQVPMDRTGGNASSGALGSIQEVLRAGGFVAVFPEGHRSPDGRLYKGHTGVARLALADDVPIIPVGCFRTRFVRRWLPFPWLYRPELCFGEPFHLSAEQREAFLGAPDYKQASTVLRQATADVMVKIQAITGQEMVDEYSYVPRKVGAATTSRRRRLGQPKPEDNR